jgi:hypothetical protein
VSFFPKVAPVATDTLKALKTPRPPLPPVAPKIVPRAPVAKKDVSPTGTVQKTIERGGEVVSERTFHIDDFKELTKEDGNAVISCSVTKGVDFNSEKVTFFVSARCDQNEPTMNKAAELVLFKAMSYVNDAGELLGWKKGS